MRNADTMHHFKGEKHKWTPNRQRWNKTKKKQVWNEDHPCRFLSLPHAINLKQPDHWHIHPLDCMRFAMENITLALCCCSVHIPSPFPPLSQPSLSNDRSITATICGDVIFFESWKGGVLSCPSALVCGTFQRFNICMAVRPSRKANFVPLNRKKRSCCETNLFS